MATHRDVSAIVPRHPVLADRIVDVKEIPEQQLTPTTARFVRSATADAIAVLDGDELIRTFA